MAKGYQEYQAGDSVVRARVSSGDETVQTTSGPRNVDKDNVVIAGDNPNIVDVLTKDQWKETGYKKVKGSSDSVDSETASRVEELEKRLEAVETKLDEGTSSSTPTGVNASVSTKGK